ncbi:MAG TPA: hypothetical protein VMW14_02925 [Candidatus Paceibacterota bacterium]|nr:hypothetical protein [Candidatus Paceibacterota bacterium]
MRYKYYVLRLAICHSYPEQAVYVKRCNIQGLLVVIFEKLKRESLL